MVSSAARRTVIIRAATAMTAAPVTIRLTNSSSRIVSIAAWVTRKPASLAVSAEVTVTVAAAALSGPSRGVTLAARLSASYSGCTPAAVSWPVASGSSQWMNRPDGPNAFCRAAAPAGSASTAPTQ